MEVRPARHEDLDHLLDLTEAVAAEGRWIATEAPIDRVVRRERYVSNLDAPDRDMFVAEIDGRIVGVLGMEGTGVAELGMFVASDIRRRGIGSALLAIALDWAREKGAHKVALEVWPHNEAALHMYKKFGFEQEGYLRSQYRRRNGELWDAVLMALVLD
jgi:RimJ/RimL family protein N-acetyltransferase